jgi:hypothetical protein
MSDLDKDWDNPDDAIYDSLDKGYELLAKDPEMSSRRRSFNHHCSFNFKAEQTLAKCTCGKISTNPYFFIKGGR